MLNEWLFVKLHVQSIIIILLLSRVRQDRLPLLVVRERLVDGPPPAVLLEQLHYQRGVVAFADEALVKLELLALEFEVNVVLFIHEME